MIINHKDNHNQHKNDLPVSFNPLNPRKSSKRQSSISFGLLKRRELSVMVRIWLFFVWFLWLYSKIVAIVIFELQYSGMDYQRLYEELPKQPIKWIVTDIEKWLKFIGLSNLFPKFRTPSLTQKNSPSTAAASTPSPKTTSEQNSRSNRV